MRHIVMVPIEPLEMRYSTQWNKWFTNWIVDNLPATKLTILQPSTLTEGIENGAFLDVCGTNYYKAYQLASLCEMMHNGILKDGDIIFFHDAWFPGVEMLAYMRDALKRKIKIVGCLHAGTYDPTDYISKQGMGAWGRDLENAWFTIYDQLYVATEYHKNLILSNRICSPDKVKVTWFPLYMPEKKGFIKEKIVLFPHRLTEDKQPHLFDELALLLSNIFPTWRFIKTQEERLSKKAYYDLLEKSMIAVSFAKHENWGIGMQECVMMDCIPLVPDRLAYKEMYPTMFRHNSLSNAFYMAHDMITTIEAGLYSDNMWCNGTRTLADDFVSKGNRAIPTIMEHVNGL